MARRNLRSRAIAAVGALPFPGRHYVGHCYRQGLTAAAKGNRETVESYAQALDDFAQAHVPPLVPISAGAALNVAALAMESPSPVINAAAAAFTGAVVMVQSGVISTQRHLASRLQTCAEKMPQKPEAIDQTDVDNPVTTYALPAKTRPSGMDAPTPSLFEYVVADIGTQAALLCSAIGGASVATEVLHRLTTR